MTSLLWFRQDLRLRDQPALIAAIEEGPVIPVYVLDDEAAGAWRMGGAQRWWLHHSLESLDAALKEKGSKLVRRRGNAVDILNEIADQFDVAAIHAIRHYEPWWREAEAALGERLCLHDGNHLVRIDEVTTGGGDPYKIYSAFWKSIQSRLPPEHPHDAPGTIPAPEHWPHTEALDRWSLLPTKPDWASAFGDEWTPGEEEAHARADAFAQIVHDYDERRNMPSEEGTSRLSPHLHFGEISARAVWHAVDRRHDTTAFRKEVAWRDFTDGVVLALPNYADANGRDKYDDLKWRDAPDDLEAWQRGRTGYPIVDAGMRQLWKTGWMHNRVRMIVASFLTKHLLIDWRAGEKWFWDCLIDADYGNNSVNWQWVSGTGVDANMFGRIMAPLSQSEKFDAGDYIRTWVPELADVPDDAIHDPEAAGCRPDTYPPKIIAHREARERALAANDELK